MRILQNDPGIFRGEVCISYSDGYSITVGWSDEDNAWIARLRGLADAHEPLADGQNHTAALLSLCCSIACHADALTEFHAKELQTALSERDEARAQIHV